MANDITIHGTAHIAGFRSITGQITVVSAEDEDTFNFNKTDMYRIVCDKTGCDFFAAVTSVVVERPPQG